MATLPNIAPGPINTGMRAANFNTSNPTPAGSLTNFNGSSLLGVDPDAFASNQLATLVRSDNPLLAQARGRAGNYAAARGAGADSASYAYNAEQGLADQLIPLATQAAGVVHDTETANQDALNRMALQREGTRGQITSAQIARASAMDQLTAANAYDAQRRTQDRSWQVADQGTAARASARSQFFGNLEGALLNDPSYLRDPQALIGAFTELGTNFDTFFNNAFPEYAQMATSGTIPGAAPAGGGP